MNYSRPVSNMEKDRRWRVGIVGLGKLGMPVALAMSLKGHHVMGYDLNPARMQKNCFAEQEIGPNGEPSIEPLLQQSDLMFGSLPEVVKHAEILFVAVQTPHDPLFEGVTRLPQERKDFDYSYLKSALKSVSDEVAKLAEDKIVVVISTVLPGTMRREILPLLDEHVKLCYNPFFIAMGTTIQDFLNPEFVLFGVHDKQAAEWAREFYYSLHDRPMYETSIENAEAIKVCYNTFISTKIAVANTIMELCHKLPGCDCDQVMGGLYKATDRIISTKYLRGGMGDGGGCHPRDNIALSWLSDELGMSFNWFENIMVAREKQTEFLAELLAPYRAQFGGMITILGKSFKPETNLVTGSPATLLANLLSEKGWAVIHRDPMVDGHAAGEEYPSAGLYIIGTQHQLFKNFQFASGSVVIDPFRYLPSQEGVTIIPVGIGQSVAAASVAR